ncbi:MAG: hypothetical protein JOY60_03315 [Burkholderiaceae bacterium]|nr:hypothetical protein [Roseateles sp.]MBV8468878.1 hypothetical protein [Burkholderiaceae bacterium]
MRAIAITLAALIAASTASVPASAQVSIGFSVPGVSIGVNVPAYPQLVPIPGYPVYYAPDLNSNFFFYEGQYWAFMGDNWYVSNWYNGPWMLVSPMDVPYFILRVPVGYYRMPPPYFRGWVGEMPPRWGDRFGRDWSARHRGWDEWDHRNVPHAAPLPEYQRQYGGRNYPAPDRQQELHRQNYNARSPEPGMQRPNEQYGRGPAPAAPQAAQPAPYVQPGRGGGNAVFNPAEERGRPYNPGQERVQPQAQPQNQPRERGNEHGNERANERGNERGNDREHEHER